MDPVTLALLRATLRGNRYSRLAGLIAARQQAEKLNLDGASGHGLDWCTHQESVPMQKKLRRESDMPFLPPTPLPDTCCLWPWPNPDGSPPLYPYTDLAASIDIYLSGVFSVTLNQTPSGFPLNDWAYADGGFTNVIYPPGAGGVWVAQGPDVGGTSYTFHCLIGIWDGPDSNFEARDQFGALGSTLSVNGADSITRMSLCTWTGSKTGGGLWLLDYGRTTPYKWHLASTDGSPTSDDKDDPQSAPTGTYGSETVS